MGALALPAEGTVYLDAAAVIYSVEQIAPYDGLLAPLWQAANAAQFLVVSYVGMSVRSFIAARRARQG